MLSQVSAGCKLCHMQSRDPASRAHRSFFFFYECMLCLSCNPQHGKMQKRRLRSTEKTYVNKNKWLMLAEGLQKRLQGVHIRKNANIDNAQKCSKNFTF